MFRPLAAMLFASSLFFGHSTLSAQTIVAGQAACCLPAQTAVSAPTYSAYPPVTTHYAPVTTHYAPAQPAVVYHPQTPIAAPIAVTSSAPVVTYSPVIPAAATAPVMAYSGQPVVTYSPVVPAPVYGTRHQAVGIVTSPGHFVTNSAYYSAPLPATAYQPYQPVVTSYAPTAYAAPAYAVPTVTAAPVIVAPYSRLFVPGQPIRNFFRAITP